MRPIIKRLSFVISLALTLVTAFFTIFGGAPSIEEGVETVRSWCSPWFDRQQYTREQVFDHLERAREALEEACSVVAQLEDPSEVETEPDVEEGFWQKPQSIWEWLAWYVGVASVIILVWQYWERMGIRGGFCGRLGPYRLLTMLDPFRHYAILSHTTKFQQLAQHRIRCIVAINPTDVRALQEELKNSLRILVGRAQKLTDLCVGSSVSTNFKLFTDIDSKSSSSDIRDKRLIPMARAYSKRERKLQNKYFKWRERQEREKKRWEEKHQGRASAAKWCPSARRVGLPPRSFSERFEVDPMWAGKISVLRGRHESGRLECSACTAFDEVFHHLKPWICNKLMKAAKEERFYSTKEDWPEYYRSMGMFLIAEYNDQGRPCLEPGPAGLFIFDSHKTGIYDVVKLKVTGEFIAHEVYRVIKAWSEHLGQASEFLDLQQETEDA